MLKWLLAAVVLYGGFVGALRDAVLCPRRRTALWAVGPAGGQSWHVPPRTEQPIFRRRWQEPRRGAERRECTPAKFAEHGRWASLGAPYPRRSGLDRRFKLVPSRKAGLVLIDLGSQSCSRSAPASSPTCWPALIGDTVTEYPATAL